MTFYSPPLGRFSTDSQLGLWYSTWIFCRFIIKLIGSIISRFSVKKEPASIALNAAVIIRQDSSQRQLQLVLYRLVCPSHLSVLPSQCSLNFIRLRLVVITPPVKMLLRGENDSKQSDEIQTPAGGYSIYPWVGRCGPAPHTLTLFKTKIADFPTLFKTKIPKNIPWLAARPH